MSKSEYMKAYRQTPEYKARRKELDSTPEARERQRVSRAKSYAKHKDTNAARSRLYHETNAGAVRMRKKARYQENAEAQRAAAAEWRRNNPGKALAAVKAYQAANPGLKTSIQRRRDASKLKATPDWSISFFMDEAYRLAKLRTTMTGIEHHVDHIVPLRSAIVCGLHSHTNVQVITAKQNKAKSNAYWPGMP